MAGPNSTSKVDSGDPLRESFFAMLRRSYQGGVQGGMGAQVYLAIVRSLQNLCGEAWFQRTVFPIESDLVLRFSRDTGIGARDPKAFVQRSLVTHACARAFGDELQEVGREEFGALCTASGKENLLAARAAGRGLVVAHTHTVLGELFWTWLRHEGIDAGLTLWQWTFDKDREQFHDPKMRVVESARELREALALLKKGGTVHVMADGQKGGQQLDLPAFGRSRAYRLTFAEIALEAGATVVPAAVLVNPDGRVVVDVGTPFRPPEEGVERRAKVQALVRDYAAVHQALWRGRPANIPWAHMQVQLQFPPA